MKRCSRNVAFGTTLEPNESDKSLLAKGYYTLGALLSVRRLYSERSTFARLLYRGYRELGIQK